MNQKPSFQTGYEYAVKLDHDDPLKNYREHFYHPDPHVIYLDGNSLGKLPKKTIESSKDLIERQWGDRLIRSWNEGWYTLSEKLAGKLSKIVGAGSDEIAIGDSTSVNLYKTALSALKLNPDRKKIVSDVLNFPTDIYVLQGIADHFGGDYNVELAQSADGISVSLDALDSVVDENTALVVLSAVVFKSAFRYDMKAVTDLVHQKGALIIWDLSHAAGAVPVDLNGCGADMAIGCTYKYLNGGPGSPAYLYVSKKLQKKVSSPIWGWFGDQNPFAFDLDYKPADGIRKFLAGTPPVLSLAAVEPGLDLILEAGMDNLRKKSILQSDYLVYLWAELLKPLGFEIGSPKESDMRGSHISLRHPEAYRICKALIEPKGINPVIIPDFREPDNIRLGIAPLYNSFGDIYQTAARLRDIVSKRLFEDYPKVKNAVT